MTDESARVGSGIIRCDGGETGTAPNSDSDRTPCPFCGLALSNEQFDGHVSNCMMVTEQ